jgi:hypothetical protein
MTIHIQSDKYVKVISKTRVPRKRIYISEELGRIVASMLQARLELAICNNGSQCLAS